MQGMNALMPGEHDWLDKGNPSAPSVSPEPQKKSGLMNALGAVFKYGAPEAYDQGRQRKAIETMGNALSMGNYEDAAKAAFQSGNLDQGMQLRQYADSRQAAGAEQEAAMRQQQAQGTLSLFSQMEPDQITNFALEQPQEFERITGMSSDEYMQAGARMRQSGMDPAQFRQLVIQKAQAELGQMPEAPEYYAPVETDNGFAQFSKDGSDPRQFEGIAPPPEGPMSSMGKLAADLSAGRITQQQYDMEIARLGKPATTVNVTTGGPGQPNPYANLPDDTFIEAPDGTAPLKGGQMWVVRNGRPTIVNAEGGDAAQAEEEAETKRLGRQASTQRAGRTVVREVGRGLELMPNIIGWGGESVPGESEVSVGGDEIAQANARAFMAKVPGSAEYQFMQNIESALSNVGLDRLQEMRENSPTGGALGQVPFQQQQRLEQVLGAFKITMPRPVMEENLKYMNNAYMDIMFGSEEEREALVQQGRLSPEQNQQIQQNYYNLNWNEFGRFEPPPEGFEIIE